jgi:hypothetical protein
MANEPTPSADSAEWPPVSRARRIRTFVARALAFCAGLFVGLFVQLFVWVWLALSHEHGNSPDAASWMVVLLLTCPALSLATLGRIVKKRRRAKHTGEPMNTLPEVALLGLAMSTLLLGVCAGVVFSGALLGIGM